MAVLDTQRGVNRTLENFTTNGDLYANAGYVVKIFDSNTVGLASATTEPFVGIIDSQPQSGTSRSVSVCTNGLCIAYAGAAFTAGADLTADSTGRVTVWAGSVSASRVGSARTSALAAGERVSVYVNVDNRHQT